MDQFCGNCGAVLGPAGVCPVCGAVVGQDDAGKQKKPGKQKKTPSGAGKGGKKKKRPGLIAAAVIAGVLVLAFGLLTLLQALGVVDIPLFRRMLGQEEESREIPAEYLVEPPEAESYYEARGRLLGRIPVSDSNALTEAEAVRAFHERGFTQTPITWEYKMDGTYHETVAAAEDGTARHPMYQAVYTTYRSVWIVYLINGSFYAEPASANAASGDRIMIFSETETLTSYDGSSNAYYVTIPDSTLCLVCTEHRIDAPMIEGYDY